MSARPQLMPGDRVRNVFNGQEFQYAWKTVPEDTLARVEAVGADWIIFRSLVDDNGPIIAVGPDVHERHWRACTRAHNYDPNHQADKDARASEISDVVQLQLKTVRRCPFADSEGT